MNRSELIKKVTNRVTANGKIGCGMFTNDDVSSIIDIAINKFENESNMSQQEINFIVDYSVFQTNEFKGTYTLILPNNIYAVHEIKEIKSMMNSMNLSSTAIQDKFLAYAMNAYSVTNGLDIVMRASYESTWDIAKSFMLGDIPFSYNENDHSLVIKRKPTSSVMIRGHVNIDPEKLFDNYLFQDYVTARVKLLLCDLLDFINSPMPGGFQFETSNIRSSAESEIDRIDEKLKGFKTVNVIKTYN